MTRLPSARVRVSLVAAAAGAAALLWAPRTPAAQTRPGDPATTEFLAVGADGRPVRDLKPEELSLRVDGRTRTVRSLQLIPIGDAPGSGVKTGDVDLPAPFDTNVVSRAGRAIMIVIDDESLPIGGERPVKDAIGQMIAELAPTDRVAIATVPHGGLKIDFTADRGRLQQALGPIVGQPHRANTEQEAACQTRLVLQEVTGVLRALDPAVGPTTVALLTGGLVGPRSDTFGSARGAIGSGSIGVCELTADHFEEVAQTAAAAHAQFFVIQPESDFGTSGEQSTALFGGNVNPQVGLEHLAGVTGTQVLKSTRAGNDSLTRVARETSAYYVMTFDSEAGDRRPGSHRLELKTARPGVTLRVRPVLGTGRADQTGAARSPRETLRDARPYRDLPLRSAVFVSRSPDQKMMIVATVEPLDPSARLTDVVAGLYAGDRLIAEWTAKAGDLAALPVRAGLLAAPGAYRLRVAGRDGRGRLGAVDSRVTAELTPAGPLKLSSLVLGVPGAGGAFTPKLDFVGDPAVMLFFELYGGQSNMQLGAAIELAATPGGPALATAQPKWGGTTEADRFTATAQIPIDTLPPGDYVVRVIIGVAGQPEGRIVRTLRKR